MAEEAEECDWCEYDLDPKRYFGRFDNKILGFCCIKCFNSYCLVHERKVSL